MTDNCALGSKELRGSARLLPGLAIAVINVYGAFRVPRDFFFLTDV